MLEIGIENSNGEYLQISQNKNYTITEISGLTPPQAIINLGENALLDGATFNSSKIQNRNIVLNFAIEYPAEANRLQLYKFFQSKQAGRIFIKSKAREVFADFRTETVDISLFEQKQLAQISLICPSAFFNAVNDATSDTETITNNGDVATGGIINFAFSGDVDGIEITNETTGQTMTIGGTYSDGDTIRLSTQIGEKSLTGTVGGVYRNLINRISANADWLTFATGENEISITATTGTEYISHITRLTAKYLGV